MNMTKAILAVLLTLAFSLSHAAEQVSYYHNNLVGSPVAATDDTGALLWEQSYNPWGAPLLPPSDSRSFTGAPADAVTELVDMQARWYSPHVGRMLALDPAGFREDSVHSFNLYAYGNNNPYRFVDPSGNIPVETVWDAANVGMGIASLGSNWSQGNYGGAAIDLLGLVVDSAATVVPYVPGGAGTAIKAARGLDAVGDVAKGAGKADTLKPGPFAKESIPAHRGRPTSAEQKQVNELMERYGCHTCGTKNAGTKSGNAVADHQPPQALAEPENFYPHCINCARRQGGQVLQEKLKRN